MTTLDWVDEIEAKSRPGVKQRLVAPTWPEVRKLIQEVRQLREAVAVASENLLDAADIMSVLIEPPPLEDNATKMEEFHSEKAQAIADAEEFIIALSEEESEEGDEEEEAPV